MLKTAVLYTYILYILCVYIYEVKHLISLILLQRGRTHSAPKCPLAMAS